MRYISEVTVRWTTQWTTHLSLSQSCDTHKLTKTSRRLTWVMHSCRSSSWDLIMYLFSLLGKTADWAIYFACVNFFLFLIEQSYLRIYSTNFHNFFTKWKVFVWILSMQTSFSDSSRDTAMATNFVAKLPTLCIYRSGIPKRNTISLP